MIGYVKQIETMGIFDGPGIRTVIFLQGCPLRCLYCHNPEMWDYNDLATAYTVEELFAVISKYQPYFGTTGGVTFSGGEPLGQSEFLLAMIKRLKEENISVVLDTAGSIYNKQIEQILDYVDLVILDIKGLDDSSYQQMTGLPMNNYELFLKFLKEKQTRLWLRNVIVPGVNDNLDYINLLADYIKGICHVEKVELLPYHKMGNVKYERLGIVNPLKNVSAMDIDKCRELEQHLIELLK